MVIGRRTGNRRRLLSLPGTGADEVRRIGKRISRDIDGLSLDAGPAHAGQGDWIPRAKMAMERRLDIGLFPH